MFAVAAFAASVSGVPRAKITGYGAADEIGCERRQPIQLVLRISMPRYPITGIADCCARPTTGLSRSPVP
jgi:hypothetical protein